MDHMCSRELLIIALLTLHACLTTGFIIKPSKLQAQPDIASVYDMEDFINGSSEEDLDDAPYDPEHIRDNHFVFTDGNGRIHSIPMWGTLETDDNALYDFEQPMYEFNETDMKTFLPGSVSLAASPKYVTLDLYTQTNRDDPFELTPIDSKEAPMDLKKPTKVIIHGYLESGNKNWMQLIKNYLLAQGDFNVITVDWFHILALDYVNAARNCRKVGEYVGTTLSVLAQTGKIRVEDIHIVGFSLGAHVAGYAGKSILAQTGYKPGRITGLDPARPLFEFPLLVSERKRLSKNDAVFVDVIHTSGGNLGFKRALGHVDFWPNSGRGIQPGCGIIKNIVCSHLRAHSLFEESINNKQFVASECTSWRNYRRGRCDSQPTAFMGYYATKNLTGDYYLRTNAHAPFAQG